MLEFRIKMTRTRYNTGFCVFVIIIYAFLDSALCCQSRCAKCLRNSDFCEECNDGYFLLNKSCLSCPNTCEKCTNNSNCSECKTDFWDIRLYHACGSSCTENCGETGCDDVTCYCHQCKPGFYGSSCQNNCSLCAYHACNLRQCTFGCTDGYYDDTLSSFTKCVKCYGNCTLCDSMTNCKQCADGFFLERKIYHNSEQHFCSPCPADCKECNDFNNCTVCKSGKYGHRCSYDCNIANCQKCIEVGSIVKCTECINRYRLANNTCTAEEIVCSQNCNNGNRCDSNGNCLGGCKGGWTGPMCANSCTQNCQQCDQNNAALCTKCEGDFYTFNCSIPCSSHCSVLSDKATCYINNGTCLNGCQNGYKGSYCEEVFAVSTSTVTETPFPVTTKNEITGITKQSLEEEKQSVIVIGAGTGVGLLVVICLVIIVLCVIKRRIKTRSSPNVREDRLYINTNITMQAVSFTETGGGIGNVGYNQTVDETPQSVYERLGNGSRDDQHQYSGLGRHTDQLDTGYVNM